MQHLSDDAEARVIALTGIGKILAIAAEEKERSEQEVKFIMDKATGIWVPHPLLRSNNKGRKYR